MEWWEGELDPHLPSLHKRGLAVEIKIADEVVFRHAVMQPVKSYRKTDCVKAIFYWMIDNGVFDDLDMSHMTTFNDTTIRDIPF